MTTAERLQLDWGWPQMEEALQCPICFELPKGPISVCREGHHVCHLCRTRLIECPLCKESFVSTRIFAMEELLKNISVIKNLMTLADITQETPTKTRQTESVENVPSEPKICSPVQSRGFFWCVFCSTSHPVSRMLIHLRYAHADSLVQVESVNNEVIFDTEFQLNTRNDFSPMHVAIHVVKLGVFIVTVERFVKGQLLVFLRMVANSRDANKHTCWLRSPFGIYSSKVASCRQETTKLYSHSECLKLTSATYRRRNLVVNVTIKRVAIDV